MVARAEALAEPAGAAVARILDASEAGERRALEDEGPSPDRTELDERDLVSRSKEEAVDGLTREIADLAARIGPLVTARKRLKGSLWSRLVSRDVEDELEALLARRRELQAQLLAAEVDMGRAMRARDRAAAAFDKSLRAARSAREHELGKTRVRLAAIERARSLVVGWPTFAYAGIRRLIGIAGKIERARARAWDVGPNAGPGIP